VHQQLRLTTNQPLCTQLPDNPTQASGTEKSQSLNWFDTARQLTESGAINMKRSLLKIGLMALRICL